MKQVEKDFVQIQKDFFGDVAKTYFGPFKMIWLFLSIPLEMLKQAITSFTTDSVKFQEIQDDKLSDERQAGLKAEKDL